MIKNVHFDVDIYTDYISAKNTHKNCAFCIVLHTVFMRFSVLSGKTKSTKETVFCGNFHIIWILWVSPLFNSAKICTKGAIGLQAERL